MCSRWLTDKYLDILDKSVAIIEYSLANIGYFGKYDNLKKKLFYVPVGTRSVEKVDEEYLDNQCYDVLFYGDINCCRRRRIIETLGKDFNVHVEYNCFGDEMLLGETDGKQGFFFLTRLSMRKRIRATRGTMIIIVVSIDLNS